MAITGPITGTLPPPMMYQACAGTRHYAPKLTPQQLLQTMALEGVLRKTSFPSISQKRQLGSRHPLSHGATAQLGQTLQAKAWLMQEMVKILHPFASASRGSTAFFFHPQQEEGGKAESSNLQALGCFSP